MNVLETSDQFKILRHETRPGKEVGTETDAVRVSSNSGRGLGCLSTEFFERILTHWNMWL